MTGDDQAIAREGLADALEAMASGPELSVLVVIDMTGDRRAPGQVAADVRMALEMHADEAVIFTEDLPEGVRILAPGEHNGSVRNPLAGLVAAFDAERQRMENTMGDQR